MGTNTINVLPNINGQTYYLYLTNSFNCTYVDSITVYPAVMVNAGANQSSCNAVWMQANASGGAVNFVWSSQSNFSDTISLSDSLLSPDSAGTFWYYVSATNGFCSGTDSVQVTIYPKTPFEFFNECMGDTVIVTAWANDGNEPYTYLWQPDSVLYSGQGTDSVILFPDSSLWISLTLTNQYGCSTADSIIIQSTGLSANDFTIQAQQDTVLLGNSTEITVLPTGDFAYSWQPVNATGNTLVVTPEQNTVYSVTITDSLGCSYRKYITIYAIDVICDEPYIYIPNAFTPNGDGKNDVLYIRGEYIEQLDLKIFDRWGELVFETDKQAKGWDGTYKGEPVEPAVFVYHVKVKCLGGEEFFKKGNITVIR
jgi:gliding motility-associated-like protein